MNRLMEILNKVIEFWKRMSTAQKVSLVFCLVSLVILIVVTLNLAVKPDYVPLFYETPPPDVVYNVKKKLEEKGIPFELKDSMPYVSAEVKSKVIIDLYGEGVIPEGVDLYKWVFEPDITATKAKRTAQWIVTLQKRLELMISSLEEVKSARVNITLPPETITFGEEAKPKAGVTLDLKTGKMLKKSTAVGIGRLVASSVEKLEPKDVTIVDTAGRFYKIPDENDLYAIATEQIELKQKTEDYYKKKLLDAFSQFLGQNVIVTVDATLNIKSEKSEIHHPEAIEVEVKTRKIDTKGVIEGASPGALGNLPQEPQTKGAILPLETAKEQPSHKESESETKSTIVDKKITEEVVPPGELKNLTISIIVPYERAIAGRDGSVPQDEKAKEENIKTNLQEWTQVAANTVGIDISKEQQKIKIIPISFVAPPPIPEPTFQEKILAFLKEKYSLIILTFLALIAMFFIYKIVRRAYPKEVLAELDKIRAELLEREEERPKEAAEVMMEQIREKIKESVKKNPRGAATLVKRWMTQPK